MAFAEDLTPFFAEHGDDGTLAGQPVRVIFDEPTELQLDQRLRVPQVQIRTSQVPAAYLGASLVIPQGTFKVRDHEADGTGLSLLLLTRAA